MNKQELVAIVAEEAEMSVKIASIWHGCRN